MAPSKEAPEATLVVLESFVGRVGDEDRMFRAGDLVRASDPAAKKWPSLFGPLKVGGPLYERATAAPGELR